MDFLQRDPAVAVRVEWPNPGVPSFVLSFVLSLDLSFERESERESERSAKRSIESSKPRDIFDI